LRGDYTFGHEVNSFCPEINSQCYWLGPGTSQAVREQLKVLYEAQNPGLYKPVCIVIDGAIERDSPRSGFAADYDGLIDIGALLGDCSSDAQLVPGDLNHRRWVLFAIDGRTVDAADPPVVIDFGERLFVELSEGCRKLSGFVELDGNQINFNRLENVQMDCGTKPSVEPLFMQLLTWQVTFAGPDTLLLDNSRAKLTFKKYDWR